jgi:hypothetical protein
VDEIDVFWPPCEAPTGLRDVFQSELPDVSLLATVIRDHVSSQVDEEPVDGAPMLAFSDDYALPREHTLNVRGHDCNPDDVEHCPHHGALTDGKSMSVCVKIEKYKTPEMKDDSLLNYRTAASKGHIPLVDNHQVPLELCLCCEHCLLQGKCYCFPWNLDNSVFGSRKRLSESKTYWDSYEVVEGMFDNDWARLLSDGPRGRFVQLMTAGGKAPHTMMADIKQVVYNNFDMMQKVFTYYTFLGTGGRGKLTMSSNEWNQFIKEARIIDQQSLRCKRSDTDMVFQTANAILGFDKIPKDEEDLRSHKNEPDFPMRDRKTLSVLYDMHGLMRFEFVAAMLKVGLFGAHSGLFRNIRGKFREPLGKIQGIFSLFREHSALHDMHGLIRFKFIAATCKVGPFMGHSGDIQGTFGQHLGNIHGTFGEHSVHLWNILFSTICIAFIVLIL